MDVFRVAQEAVRRARNREGPTLIECKTYRHKGHSRFDPAAYRPKEEVEAWLGKDPLHQFRKWLLETGNVRAADVEQMEKQVIKAIESAVKFAINSPYPEPHEALEDVYAG